MRIRNKEDSQDSEANGNHQSKLNCKDHTSSAERNLVYGVNDVPPWPTLFASAFQHFFYCIGTIASYPVLLMPFICYDDSQAGAEYRTILAGTCLFAAGISTFLQSTFGIRIPTLQGTSVTYFVAILSVLSMEEWSCPIGADHGENMSSIHNDSGYRNISFDQDNISSTDTMMKYYLDKDGAIRTSDEVWMRRMRMIQGSIIIVGAAQMLIGATGTVGYAIRFIGPLTIAPTLAMITYSLIDIVMTLCSTHWGLASITFGIYFITSILMEKVLIPLPSCSIRRKKIKVSITRSPIFSLYPVLYSFLVGWIAYLIISKVSQGSGDAQNVMEKLSSTQWFSIPYPFQFGWPIFSVSGVLGVLVAMIPVILESLGHFTGTPLVCQEPPPPPYVVNRGILVEGLGICINGVLGSGVGTTTWTTQTSIIAASKVASRRVFQCTAILLMIVGIFTKSLGFCALLPESVIGGVMLGAIGSIFAMGVTSLRHVNMSSNRNMFVLGISIMTGIGLPKYFTANPDVVRLGSKYGEDILLSLLRSPMLIGGLTGFIFDNISPGTRQDRGLETLFGIKNSGNTADSSANLDVYKLPFNVKCRRKRKVPFCFESFPR